MIHIYTDFSSETIARSQWNSIFTVPEKGNSKFYLQKNIIQELKIKYEILRKRKMGHLGGSVG